MAETIAILTMDGVFGESLTAVASTPQEALKALKKEFYAYRKGYELGDDWMTFKEACEYFGLDVQIVPLGTAWMHGRSEGGYVESQALTDAL